MGGRNIKFNGMKDGEEQRQGQEEDLGEALPESG